MDLSERPAQRPADHSAGDDAGGGVGCFLGQVTTVLAGAIQVSLLILGVASLLQASPLAFDILRWAGAAYLAWLGANLIAEQADTAPAQGRRRGPSRLRQRFARARSTISPIRRRSSFSLPSFRNSSILRVPGRWRFSFLFSGR
ncbi:MULTISPECIES: LysE family transporter [Rhizobium]|uniref:LysE family translocator n=1 Tax=Rhizobium TaxID=379 RepID=UPI0024A6CAF8|nr:MULTISPECIES: LysE family transporter [Rhizobium]